MNTDDGGGEGGGGEKITLMASVSLLVAFSVWLEACLRPFNPSLACAIACLSARSFICQPEKKDGNVNDKERKDTLKQILLTCFPQTKMTHLCISTKPCSCSRPWSCTETAIIVYLRNTAKVRILILKLLGIAHSPKACRTTAS